MKEGGEACLFVLSHSCIWKGITESLWQVLPSRASPAAEPHAAAHINVILGRSLGSYTTEGLSAWQQLQQWKKALTMESGLSRHCNTIHLTNSFPYPGEAEPWEAT